MRYAVMMLLFLLMLIAGCTQAQSEDYPAGNSSASFETPVDGPPAPQVPPFERGEPPGSVKPAPTDWAEIERMAGELTDVRLFATWLATRTNVSHVERQRMTWLSSNPPKQKVVFTLNGRRHELILPADVRVTARTLQAQQENPLE